jgi:hypothetical protein
MAEAANRRLGKEQAVDETPPSPADMKAAVRDTRLRLATRLTQTADHVRGLFTARSSAEAETCDGRDGGVIGGVIKTIAVVGRTKRAWSDARRNGVLRRAAIGAATLVIAGVIAAKTRQDKGLK